MMLLITIQFFLSFVIAQSLGSKRRIGILWSLLISLTLSIVVGLIVIFLSSRKDEPPFLISKAARYTKGFVGLLFIALGLFIGYKIVGIIQDYPEDAYIGILPTIGLIILGLYMYIELYHERYYSIETQKINKSEN